MFAHGFSSLSSQPILRRLETWLPKRTHGPFSLDQHALKHAAAVHAHDNNTRKGGCGQLHCQWHVWRFTKNLVGLPAKRAVRCGAQAFSAAQGVREAQRKCKCKRVRTRPVLVSRRTRGGGGGDHRRGEGGRKHGGGVWLCSCSDLGGLGWLEVEGCVVPFAAGESGTPRCRLRACRLG